MLEEKAFTDIHSHCIIVVMCITVIHMITMIRQVVEHSVMASKNSNGIHFHM